MAGMLFPIDDLLDEDRCYAMLRDVLHPHGFNCPNGHVLPPEQCPHTHDRAPIVDYRCKSCGRVFNVFTGTLLAGTRHQSSKLVLILRGILQGQSTRHLAFELNIDRGKLLDFRHRIQGAIALFSPLGTPAGRRRRDRRDVPKRGREGHSTP